MSRLGAWLRAVVELLQRTRQEADFDAELRAHLQLHIDEEMAAGRSAAEARRIAHARLGGVEHVKGLWREGHPLRWMETWWLDAQLGVRRLRKSWGLTVAGGFAMATAMAILVSLDHLGHTIFGTGLPLDDGERVVALAVRDARTSRRQAPLAQDVDRWRRTLRSVTDVGAFRTVELDLGLVDGLTDRVSVAEMSASGFRVARVPPRLGRPLLESDERAEAEPVLVIGHQAWSTRFSSDPDVIGRLVRLGGTEHTVVGVMPEGFAFPVNHQLWTPLRLRRDVGAEAPAVFAFGRLAPDATQAGVQSELTTLGLLPTASDDDDHLAPRVVPYALGVVSVGDDRQEFLRLIVVLVVLLLVPPSVNIAILVYAQTVNRQQEFATRYALGAGRGRIVGQLFVQMLVLAAGAAGVAVAVVRVVGEYAQDSIRLVNGTPFWIDLTTITSRTVLVALGLALLSACIAGIVPAVQATGYLAQAGLRGLDGRSSLRLGGLWTALVVVQVALSVGLLPAATDMAWGIVRGNVLGPGFDASMYVTAGVVLDEPGTSREGAASRSGELRRELVRRLQAEPDVATVTAAAAVPGAEPWAVLELDDEGGAAGGRHELPGSIRVNRIDEAFFDAFDVSLVAGRPFDVGDRVPGHRAVIVSRTFGREALGDASPLGKRIRYLRTQAQPVTAAGPWYEIVGVVDDLPRHTNRQRVYHPLDSGPTDTLHVAIRLHAGAIDPRRRVAEIARALDPALRLEQVSRLDDAYRRRLRGRYLGGVMLAAGALSVLLLSAAGIYALMSFTVSQRRHEIGIRAALGARPHRLLAGIFRRAVAQVAVGAGAGILLAVALERALPVVELGGWPVPGAIPAAAGIMLVVGALAALGPARRGLRIEPVDALRHS